MTGTIYLASMSTLLIACCYWKRANNWGAVGAIVFGGILPVGYLVLEQVPATRALAASIGPYCSGLAAYAGAALAMIIGSLLKPQRFSRRRQPHERTSDFWLATVWACLVWYSTITFYVAWKGFADIRSMLKRLHESGTPLDE